MRNYDYSGYWNGGVEQENRKDYYSKLYNRILKDLLPPKKAKIIDVGGGNAGFMRFLGIKEAVIFDISDSGLKVAEKYGFKTKKGDLLKKFPFKKETFDVAYCFEVAEHLEDSNNMFSEINRILKKGGVLYLSIPNLPPDGVHHKKRWKMKELIKDMNKSGFRIVWVNNNPRFNGNYSLKEINESINIFMKIKKILSNIFNKLIPENLRLNLSKKWPDVFSSVQILKLEK
jgi:SAM-dependent methyltransferase